MDGDQRGKRSVGPDAESEGLIDSTGFIKRSLYHIIDTLDPINGLLNGVLDDRNHLLEHVEDRLEQPVPTVSEVERTRVPIQGETRRVRVRRDLDRRRLQRGITESIETYKKRRRPTCPRFIMEQIQKVEINNIPEGQCSICLDHFQAETEVCLIVPCSHTFHKACIMKWLEENNVSPICRFTFPTKRIKVE